MPAFPNGGGIDLSMWLGQQFWIRKDLSLGPEARILALPGPFGTFLAWELVLVGLYN